MRLPFYKFCPGGNPTLLFTVCPPEEQQAAIAAECLHPLHLYAEQAGFVHPSEPSLRMAGGEFCLNATRCLGLLLALEERLPPVARDDCGQILEWQGPARVSGLTEAVTLSVRRQEEDYHVWAHLPLSADIHPQALAPGVALVHLPGISHLLLDARHPFPAAHWAEECDTLRARFGLADKEAVGCVWWEDLGQDPAGQRVLRAHPVVTVRQPFSQCYESSCGSGALALALFLHSPDHASDGGAVFSILQPSRMPLEVRLCSQAGGLMAQVGGPVWVTAQGTAFVRGRTA